MMRDSLYTTMSTCGLLIWLSIGANAMVGVYNLLGGIDLPEELDDRAAARSDRHHPGHDG